MKLNHLRDATSKVNGSFNGQACQKNNSIIESFCHHLKTEYDNAVPPSKAL